MNLIQKIIQAHLVSGTLEAGNEIAIRVDQTLTQDATGTLSYLQFEATGADRVKVDLAVSYIDHNMMQGDFRNADDHIYLQDVAAKYGIHFSRPGNGICHQVHLERFAVPGVTLLGTDSHTPTCGGMGTLSLGAGGLDIAIAMAGSPYYFKMPKVRGIYLEGQLSRGVSAKDIIMKLLSYLSVKGGIGWALEYYGPGVVSLDVPQRATITNMGAELGATTSIFPSDEQTLAYLIQQGRESCFQELRPDADACYDDTLTLNLSELEPLIARPDSPDNVCPITEVSGTPVNQVAIGSCTNSSFADLMAVASALRGKTIHPNVNMVVSPGSKQVLQLIAENGALADMIAAGARILESACGPCAGMGQIPSSGAVSVRSFNRNFPGRSGGLDNHVYLASPIACTASALSGYISDPRDLDISSAPENPERFKINTNGIIPPPKNGQHVQIQRGPNIQPVPVKNPMSQEIVGDVLIKLGDNISTDHILPAGPTVLPLRSNVPAIREYLFKYVDADFINRVKKKQGGIIVGGHNYGQGSSREHAALCPMSLGVTVVIAKSFSRIHFGNLINYGILPLTLQSETDYDVIQQGDTLNLDNVIALLESGSNSFPVQNQTSETTIITNLETSRRQREILLAGGLLTYVGENNKNE